MEEKKREEIVGLLRTAYNMELESVINYLANSVWLDGIRAKHIKDSLTQEVDDELGHAKLLADRIKILEGMPPGSMELKFNQTSMQPPSSSVDVKSVIMGVVDAEEGAIAHDQKIIDACEGADPVTQDLCVEIMGDEEGHRRQFKGYLWEAESMSSGR